MMESYVTRSRQRFGVEFFRNLLSLGEATGCLSVENPESDVWGMAPYQDLGTLCSAIEATLGISLATPRVFGLFGIDVCNRLIGVILTCADQNS